MVALWEHPTPEIQPDSAIFEVSEEDEYRSVAESFKRSPTVATPLATNQSESSSSPLIRLIRNGDYTGAKRLRADMIQHQLPIHPHPIFAWPAARAADSLGDPAVRLKEFHEWISLLPVARDGEKRKPMFGRLVHCLSRNPRPDTQFIIIFVLTCVSKGHLVHIPDRLIPLVVRFSTPSVSLQFLEDLASLVTENITLDKQMKRKIRFWCSTAMEEYLRIGLIEEAIKALQMGLRYGNTARIPAKLLREAVSRAPGHSESYEEALAVLEPCISYSRVPRFGLKAKPPPPFDLKLRPSTRLRPKPRPSRAGESDAKSLLRKLFGDGSSLKEPDPLDVARFFEICDSEPTAVRALSTHNCHKPHQYRKQWVLGEMIYYARRKEWRELIGAFCTYFFWAGVPATIDKYKSRGRVTALKVEHRMFPSPFHTSLVWTAAVEILQGARRVSTLFEELVEQVASSKTRKYAQVNPSLVYASTKMFDARHFTPFLIAAYRERRYKLMMSVFNEMPRLGIEPYVEQLSLLAAAHAGSAEGVEAVRILDRIEGILKEEETGEPLRDVSRYTDLHLPPLRRFLERKDTRGASLIRRRIMERGYERGTHPGVDRMLKALEMLSRAGS